MRELDIIRHSRNIVGMVSIAVVITVLTVILASQGYLKRTVLLTSGTNLTVWLKEFERLATFVIAVATGASVAWYVYGEFLHRVDDWRKRGRRMVWLMFASIPVLGLLLAFKWTPPIESGIAPVYLVYAADAAICFYLSTALFSPSSFKYLPPGARFLRRGW